MATTFQEGFCIFNPPCFTSCNFDFWKIKMLTFLESLNVDFVDILINDSSNVQMKRIEDFGFSMNIQVMKILNDSLDEYALSLIKNCTCAKDIWNTLCVHFEGTIEGKTYSKELEELEEDEPSTSESIDDDQEQDARCLMGLDHQEVSSSKSKNCEFSFDELLDAFYDLIDKSEKLISKNEVLKNQNASLSQEVSILNEKCSFKNSCSNCNDFKKHDDFLKENNSCLEKENELLKEMILNFERDNFILKENEICAKLENETFKNQVHICQKDKNILQEQINIIKEQNITKEKNLDFGKKNQVLKLFSKEHNFRFQT